LKLFRFVFVNDGFRVLIHQHNQQACQGTRQGQRGDQAECRNFHFYRGILRWRHRRILGLHLVGSALSLALPEGAKESEYKRVYVGRDAAGQIKGVAIERGEPGFQDIVQLIFGYDPATGRLSGMKVLDSKETPGLGDKIFKDQSFVEQFFSGPETPLVAVKSGAGKGLPGEIDTITGATISSKVVIDIINHALEEWVPVLDKGIPAAPVVPEQANAGNSGTGREETTQ
jgi:RnfABCDGE-type electron transport complex G subunit